MFETFGRSWEFAKISYGIIWDFKKLIILPIISTAAMLLVVASFTLPLWKSGQFEKWMQMLDEDAAVTSDPTLWIWLFMFYFCSYFVIVFFNAALTACAMKVVNGEDPSIADGLSTASKRLPQILGWALVSAVVGVGLKAIENANEKAGRFIASILGTAWSAMTYFVVPVIVIEGVGPVQAFKNSLKTLKDTWGEALVGNFSLGWFSFLITLPVILICGGMVYLSSTQGSQTSLAISIALSVILIGITAAATSAADVIFKALLFNYATGKSMPENIDSAAFRDAFVHKE